MDEELKQHLEGMESRIVDRVTNRLEGHIDASGDRLKTHIGQAVYDSETKLLGEFWKWARTADARYRQNEAVVTGVSERIRLLEDRVSELERERRKPDAA